jgi:hypothetical protein
VLAVERDVAFPVGGSFVSVRVSPERATAALRAVGNEVPYAAATFLTRMAVLSRDALPGHMASRFDRPTPFTQRRVSFSPASASRLRAMFGVPQSDEASGRQTSEYLRPGAFGTPARHQKKSEYLLSRNGYLPLGWVMVPGSFMKNKLDGYGNVPGSYYKQVIRDLQIKNTKGPPKPRFAAAGRRAARMGVASEFFAVGAGASFQAAAGRALNSDGGGLPPGVYRRRGVGGRRLDQYFLFVRRAKYEKRIDLGKVAEQTFKSHAGAVWNASLTTVRARFAARAAAGGRS